MRRTFSARRAASRAFGSVVFTCSCWMRDVTRFLENGMRGVSDKSQIELYRSINIRCDDVLENLRKATPCFIVWSTRTRATRNRGQLVLTSVSQTERRTASVTHLHMYWKLVSSLKCWHVKTKKETIAHRRGRHPVKPKKKAPMVNFSRLINVVDR
jgi:hypothetical protein